MHVLPFLFATIVLMFIFLLQFLMRFLDQLAGKGLSAAVIAEFIFLNLAHMIVLAVPMGVLIAVIMAYGGLAGNSEITAMRANGISLYRMMAPTFIASIIICFGLIYFFNNVLPDANYHSKVLTTDIYRKKPTLSLVPGLYSYGVQGYAILVSKTFEQSNDLEGITIHDFTNSRLNRTVTAQRGVVSFSQDYTKLVMDLEEGEIHEVNFIDFKQYRKIKFHKHRISMATEGFQFTRSDASMYSRGDRELSAQAMRVFVDSLQRLIDKSKLELEQHFRINVGSIFTGERPSAPPYSPDPKTAAGTRIMMLQSSIEAIHSQIEYYDRQKRAYSVEIYKKYAIPVACIVFVLIGAPLGVMSRKGTFGMAASLSLGFFTLYWACLILGEKFAERGYFDPWFGMWIANIVLGLFGIYITIRVARENLYIDWSVLQRFIPKRLKPKKMQGEE
jgi:lipopolysaccharide export system permease protein